MSSTIKQAIQALKSRVADAFAAVETKGGTLPATQDSANLPSAIASIRVAVPMDAYEMTSGTPQPDTPTELLANQTKIVSIHDDTCEYFPDTKPLSALKVIRCASATYSTAYRMFFQDNHIEEIYLDSLEDLGLAQSFSSCSALRIAHLPNAKIQQNYQFLSCSKLIDILMGAKLTRYSESGGNMLLWWSPTEALLENSTSLLTQDDIDAGFTSNREKLLWNIRNHIAANLNPNITVNMRLSTAVYDAIDNEVGHATKDAFPASWTLVRG